jgi:hypothetical protein
MVIAGSVAGVTTALASSASAATVPVQIFGVVWSGNNSNPTVTVSGSGFGKKAPVPAVAVSSLTNCPGGTGTDYKVVLFQDDSANWAAAHNTTTTTGTCVGISVSTWTNTQVVFTFGSAYGSFGWVANNGDNFALGIKNYYWGGVINGLT